MGTSQHQREDPPDRTPITSKTCGHTICRWCCLNVSLQEEAKNENGVRTSLPWLDCPVCHYSFAFNADQLGDDAASPHSYSAHHPHVHYSPSTSYYAENAGTAYVTPVRESYSPRTGYSWQTMDYSPLPLRHADVPQPSIPRDFYPPPPPPPPPRASYRGLSPPDIRRPNAHVAQRFSPVPTSSGVQSPVKKRLRVPISRSIQANKDRAVHREEPEDQESTVTSRSAPSPTESSSQHWLTCRVCHKPVVVTCQRLLSGPRPDHESLWPQVRLGKRLAASLRQHNLQHHPDIFMWNVKGRSLMTCASEYMDDEEAVAQASLLKALEASFEQLPHVAGVDHYESKSAFLSRTLRRIGFAYAYISYTSSEWTKWQQWKKDCYSRVQIQAKARQLLEKYECNLKEAVDDQWQQISSLEHQEKLDLYQNIFVLPQCIFECLNQGRLTVQYSDMNTS